MLSKVVCKEHFEYKSVVDEWGSGSSLDVKD